MRRTKTVALTFCMLTTIAMLEPSNRAGAQNTQQAAPPQAASKMPLGSSVAERLERMSKDLNLTQEQKEKIRPLLEEQDKQMRELRSNTSLTPEQKRDKARAMVMETREKIYAVLNVWQREKLKQQLEPMRQQHESDQNQPPSNQ
jgi:periplasmic protein CpxP/Spy